MNDKFIILADANCDLSKDLREKYGVEYLACHFNCPDGTEETTFQDWKDCKFVPDCTCEKFYDAVKKYPDGFSTAPANAQECFMCMEKFAKQGYDVLAVTISAGISGSFSFMSHAGKQIEEKYPDVRVRVVDSRRYATAIGLLLIRASELRSAGKTLDETADYLEENKCRYHQVGWLDDLSFVAKKGRISNAKAFFGQLVGIKPMGEFDANGLISVIGKVKGEKLGYKVALRYMEALGEELGEQMIAVAHTGRAAQAIRFKEMIEEKFHPRAVYINEVFPSSGINIGPGLMAAYFYGKPLSEGLKTERETLSKAIEESK